MRFSKAHRRPSIRCIQQLTNGCTRMPLTVCCTSPRENEQDDNQATDEPRSLSSRRGINQLQLFGGQMSTLRFEKNGNAGFITLTQTTR
jgi:hypothetical protein